MHKGAWVDGQYRYHLYRAWRDGAPSVCWVMLNPSTADASEDDPTVRKCMGYAKRWGFGSIDIVNLYAFRATKPTDLRERGFPVGKYVDRQIDALLTRDLSKGGYAHRVVCAWGTNAQRHRADSVLRLIRARGHIPEALDVTRWGAPKHPLYCRGDLEPKPYAGDVHPTKCYAWARRRP